MAAFIFKYINRGSQWGSLQKTMILSIHYKSNIGFAFVEFELNIGLRD